MDNMTSQIETEHKERRDSDKLLFDNLSTIKDQQAQNRESMAEKVNEIKTAFTAELTGIKITMAKWTGIAIGGVFIIDLLIKGGIHLLGKQ